MTFDQSEFQVRCEWGLRGLRELAPVSDVVIILDVLSFTTAIDIATARGGVIYPYPLKGESAAAYAASLGANLASARGSGFSLSPPSLCSLPAGYRLVLPSPNGATLSFAAADHAVVLAACLRNAEAVARAAASLGSTVAVIPAGETWPTGELRPAIEDWLGAGAVIAGLPGRRSPEAELACAAFLHFRESLPRALRDSSSGKELIEWGFPAEIDLASEWNVSGSVPRLVDRAYIGCS